MNIGQIKADGTFSYQDDDFMKRKRALRETIDMIKDIENKKESAIFRSKVDRF